MINYQHLKNAYTLLFFYVLMIINGSPIYGQKEYKVLLVKPFNVFINDKPLQKGDIFQENDHLTFADNKALLKVCHSNCSKTKIITGYTFQASKSASLKDYLIVTEGLSTRGGLNNECISFEDLKKCAEIGIIGGLGICIDTNLYLLNEDNYFMLQYNSKEQAGKCRLSVYEGKLAINKLVLDSISLKTNSDKFIAYVVYHSGKEGIDFVKVENLQITYINSVIVSSEIRSIVMNEDMEEVDKQEIVRSYLAIFFPNFEILQIPIGEIFPKM